MRADVIVVVASGVQYPLGVDCRAEDVRVQAFATERSLKLSMNAFSTGLPDRMNLRRTSCAYTHASIARLSTTCDGSPAATHNWCQGRGALHAGKCSVGDKRSDSRV